MEHDLSWRDGSVDTAFFRAEVGRCQLFVLRYGAEVEVRPRPFTDFVLMQMPLRGRASLECDGLELTLEAGQVAVLAPERQARLVWHSGCEQLLLKVPRSLLRLMQARLVDEGGLAADFALPAAYRLDTGQTRGWLRLVDNLLAQLGASADEPLHGHWLRHLEESLPLFLLTHPPQVENGAGLRVESPAQRQALRQLQRIEGLMRSRLGETLTLGELAAAGECRFMNGNSSAHHASPITGTQISCCFRKNLRNGMRRFSVCCSAKMSTQDWWLACTRYQPA